MPEQTRIERYNAILEELCKHPSGCKIKHLTQLLGQNEDIIRRDLNDMVKVGWIACIKHYYMLTDFLARQFYNYCLVLWRRSEAAADQAADTAAEFRSFFTDQLQRRED